MLLVWGMSQFFNGTAFSFSIFIWRTDSSVCAISLINSIWPLFCWQWEGKSIYFQSLRGQRLHGCTGLMSRVHKSETTALLFPQSLPHSSCNFLSEYCVLATLAYMELRGLKWSTTFINRGAQLTVSTALLASFLCKMELCLYQCSFLSKKQRTAAAKQYKQILWLRCIQ